MPHAGGFEKQALAASGGRTGGAASHRRPLRPSCVPPVCFCSSQLLEAADPDPTNLLLPPTPCLSAMTAVGRCCVFLASDQRCPRQAEPAGLLGGGWLGRTDGGCTT